MSDVNEKLESWLRVYDSTHDACLVGNREGFLGLKSAIEELLEQGNDACSMKAYANSDFEALLLVEEIKVSEGKRPWVLKVAGCVLAVFLIAWLIVLPYYGIQYLYGEFFK